MTLLNDGYLFFLRRYFNFETRYFNFETKIIYE